MQKEEEKPARKRKKRKKKNLSGKGNKLKLPKPERIREIVLEEIKILKGESDGESILN